MSHFTTVAVQISDLDELKSCLKEMGYTITDAKTVKGYMGTQPAQLVIQSTAGGYPIGFTKNSDGNFEVIADWWGVKGTTEREFTSKLKGTYAERKINKFATKNRYTVKKDVINQETVIELVRRIY